MRSLFVKIFLWFWVAMALIAFASFLSAVATESHPFFTMPWLRFVVRPPVEGHLRMNSGSLAGNWMSVAGNSLRLSGQAAVQIYERDGEKALRDYITELERAVRIRFFLFDGQKEQLTGQPIPEEVRELSSHRIEDGLDFKRSGESIFTAQQITGPSGKEYTLVARLHTRHFLMRDYRSFAANLVIIFITAGGVCYWLARHITRPIRNLGAAARRLAAGDLKVRVGTLMGRRHDEITELGRDFDQMAERLETLLGSQKRLLRDISHEFRSPLTRLSLALEIARRPGGHDAANALERIELEAGRLNALIGKLLMLARLESGAEQVGTEPVNLAELVEELAADADFEARGRNCRVRVESAENCSVPGNRELLRAAVENVLRNAVRHTAEDTEVIVSLRWAVGLPARIATPGTAPGFKPSGAEPAHPSSGSADSPRRAVIEVCDRGPGIPEASLADIFSPFYRVEDARDRKQGGSGLGLAITERTIRLHRGQVRAENLPRGGLKVTIELPAKSSEQD
jgi:two-component system sensor histidine kinase CpxA